MTPPPTTTAATTSVLRRSKHLDWLLIVELIHKLTTTVLLTPYSTDDNSHDGQQQQQHGFQLRSFMNWLRYILWSSFVLTLLLRSLICRHPSLWWILDISHAFRQHQRRFNGWNECMRRWNECMRRIYNTQVPTRIRFWSLATSTSMNHQRDKNNTSIASTTGLDNTTPTGEQALLEQVPLVVAREYGGVAAAGVREIELSKPPLFAESFARRDKHV